MSMPSEDSETVINKLDDLIVKAATKDLRNPMLGWRLSNIPDYGPMIQATASLERPILRRRMENLLLSINEEVQMIDRKKIDFSYFETDEFYDLVRRVLEYTARTRDKSKIRLYARILVRTPLLDNALFRPSVEDLLSILLELSTADLFLAREVFRQQRDTPENFTSIEQDELKIVKQSGWDSLPTITRMGQSDFTLSVVKLVRTGLIRQVVGTYVSYIGDAYRITPVFRTLMRLLDKLN
jgi:hypothetical protein